MVNQTKRKPTGAAAMGAGPGRPKGSKNKTPALIREMVAQALDEAGGVEYLVARAKDPKTAGAFLGLVGKVLPVQVSGDPENPVRTITRIELVALEK